MRRAWLLLLAALVICLAAYLLARSLRPPLSDADQIRGQILAAAAACDQHSLTAFLRVISEDYSDGSFDKQRIAIMVRQAFIPNRPLHVVPYLKDLQVSGETARTDLVAEVTQESEKHSYSIQAEWRKGRHGWQVTSARGWEGASDLGF